MRNFRLKDVYKSGLALALSFAMLLGSGSVVLAASNPYTVDHLTSGVQVNTGDNILSAQGQSYFRLYIDGNPAANPTPTSTTINGTYHARSVLESGTYSLYLTSVSSGGSGQAIPDVKPVSNEDAPEPKKETHKHSYSYQVVKEPTEKEDGRGESRCACGAVEWYQVIPSGTAFVKNIARQIRSAEENGVVEIYTDEYSCYTEKIIGELMKRPDVTLKTSFTDKEGNKKSFTIPAGEAPTDGQQFYGFTYLGNLYGWKEECEHVHDESCEYSEAEGADCTHVHDENC